MGVQGVNGTQTTINSINTGTRVLFVGAHTHKKAHTNTPERHTKGRKKAKKESKNAKITLVTMTKETYALVVNHQREHPNRVFTVPWLRKEWVLFPHTEPIVGRRRWQEPA